MDALYFYNFETYAPASHSTVVNINVIFEKRFRSPQRSYNTQRIHAYLLLYNTIQYTTCNAPYVTGMLFVGAGMTRD